MKCDIISQNNILNNGLIKVVCFVLINKPLPNYLVKFIDEFFCSI